MDSHPSVISHLIPAFKENKVLWHVIDLWSPPFFSGSFSLGGAPNLSLVQEKPTSFLLCDSRSLNSFVISERQQKDLT